MQTDQPVSAGPTLPARFQLLEILKESPSTSVYRVFDLADQREEALKVLRHGFSETRDLLQFKTEFAALAALDHPGIVKVYDFGLLDSRVPYFTMEYVPGKKITDFFDGQSWDVLFECLFQIASALHHIHDAGIIHLDLKPSNILVDGAGRSKLMDFSVAAENNELLDRRVRGTLHYMAPEVLRQDHVDSRADLYALGMTLYETITGALPTYGMPAIEVIRFHLSGEVRRPTAINPNVPVELERIVMKLLEKDPRHRYPSAAALLHDAGALAGESAEASHIAPRRAELLAAPLIGRASESARIEEAIERARRGTGGGLLVVGSEGMGKSRLVREATLRAQLDGARVFLGRCPVNRKSIYAPFFEIFQQMLMAVNPQADAAEEIRRILMPAEPSGTADHQRARGEKFRLFNRISQSIHDIYGFLSAVSPGGMPLILVIEDLQWADAASADLFSFLVGEARSSNLLVIGTLSDTENGQQNEEAAAEVASWEQRARDGGMDLVRLEPLAEPLVREYVESLLGSGEMPPDLIRWLLWESGGSPRHIRRVIEYLMEHGHLRSTSSGWIPEMDRIHNLRIPGGAGALWSERLESLTPVDRAMLETVAVLGQEADFSLLAHVLGDSSENVYPSLRRLASLGLLEEAVDGRTFAFPQMSLRELIYASAPEARRVEAHRRAARVLEVMMEVGAAEVVGQAAYHCARGNEDAKAIEYSMAAGDLAASSLAHHQAAEFYRVALELMDLSGDDSRKAEAREKLGDANYRANNLRGAMQVYQFLLKSVQSKSGEAGGALRSASIMKKIGKVLMRRGEIDAALSYFQSALRNFEQEGSLLDQAEMLNRIASLHREKGDLHEAERFAERALDIAGRAPMSTHRGYIRNTLGLVALARGDWPKARALFSEAIEIAQAVGSEQLGKNVTANLGRVMWRMGEWDQALESWRRNLEQSELEGDLWDLIGAYENVGLVELGRANFAQAADLFERSVRLAEKLGAPDSEAMARENLGQALEMLGRWGEAAAMYQRCAELDGFDENRASRVAVYVPTARLLARTGEIAKAESLAGRALEAARRVRDDALGAEAALVLAGIERERENDGEASRLALQALSSFHGVGSVHGVARVESFLADLCFRAQNLPEAREHLDTSQAIAARLGDRLTLARNEWIDAKIQLASGERDVFEERREAAEASLRAVDSPYELARLQFELGLLRDDPDAAAEAIRESIRMFERLGAVHELERARGALFRIRPVGKHDEAGVGGLYEIVKIVNSTLNLEEVLNRVLDIAIRRLRAERGMLILLDPITSAPRTRVARNIREGEGEAGRSPQAIIREVIQSGGSVISADARADERFVDSDSVISENVVSTLCVPLVIRGRIAGAIYVDHRQTRHLFSQRDLAFLEAFADQAAIAIENARLYEEIESAKNRLSLENESLRRDVLVEKHLDSVVGHSEAVSKIQFAIRKASASTSTVLLRGESGTGKGLVARIIHNAGPRRNGPFIKFNCAALPETLAESELFGHEKGAFTGADRRKLGRFELANGGTIFLDEVGRISLAMQAKLLRVVEEKEFERVGGTQTIKTDVKIIAAANNDLERAIQEGTFREDLFYRLNIIPILLPPLRERKEDIGVLAEHFIRKICRDLGMEPKSLEPGILDLFMEHRWPGNVRELEATLHRALVMSPGDVLRQSDFYGLLGGDVRPAPETTVGALPEDVLHPAIRHLPITDGVYEDVLGRAERQLIRQALAESGGRIRETARRLGLARNTLKAKLQKYGIAAND